MSIEWNGEGLPPVGLTVKIPDDMASGNSFLAKFEGLLVDIVGHTVNQDEIPLAVFKYEDSEGILRYHALCGDNGNFEPIRTPEQIAAKEREDAVAAMAEAIDLRPVSKPHSSYLYALYDAGYRLQEPKP